MNEKKYFRLKSDLVKIVYAFPERIKVDNDNEKAIRLISFGCDKLVNNPNYEEITESEFLEIFHEAHNELTLSYHRQFAKENNFIKNEDLKQKGY